MDPVIRNAATTSVVTTTALRGARYPKLAKMSTSHATNKTRNAAGIVPSDSSISTQRRFTTL